MDTWPSSGEPVGDLDEFLPALTAQLGQRHADDAAVEQRIDAEIGGLQGLLDVANDRLVQGVI